MRNKSFIYVILATVTLLALMVGLWSNVPQAVTAAPAAAVTDVSYISSGGDGDVSLVNWMTARRLTADTTVCKDLRIYKAMDLQWVIDQGTVNTTTIKMRITVDGTHLVDEATIATANVADVSAINQFKVHAIDTCMFVDLASANPITVTLIGKVMK